MVVVIKQLTPRRPDRLRKPESSFLYAKIEHTVAAAPKMKESWIRRVPIFIYIQHPIQNVKPLAHVLYMDCAESMGRPEYEHR